MKPVFLLTALLVCSPAAGFAQVPPAPPAPPAAPVMAAPRVPAAPAAPAVPPAPALPRVHAAPLVDVTFPDIDIQLALDMAHDLMLDINIDDIIHDAMQNVDVEMSKEQAKIIQEQAKIQAELAKEDAKAQTDQIKERMKELSERSFELKNFSNDFNDMNLKLKLDQLQSPRGPQPMIMSPNRTGGDESGQYRNAVSMFERRQYDQAIVRFDQIAAQKGSYADRALYWKAYAQYKLGKTDDALATIAELRRSYAQSKYLNDSRALEASVRQSSGKPLTGDADDDEIKLLALNAMQNSNPEGAIPKLEDVLKNTNTLSVKKRALFVLAQNELPAAHQVLLRYAKGAGNPDLQIEAIRYLTARNKQTSTAELDEIYNSTPDLEVRRAVLDALIGARDRVTLIRIAGSDAPIDIRRRAINGLGNDNMMTAAELLALYQKETNVDLKKSMLSALGSMGAADQLSQIVKSEKDSADLRNQAIRSLGNIKNERTAQMLVDLYSSTEDASTKKSVISALGNQNNSTALIAIARKETNRELKLEVVRRITDMAQRDKAAMDYLMELVK